MTSGELDLVMLVPGEDERALFRTVLTSRPESLGIRRITFELLKSPNRDPGCFHDGPGILKTYSTRARYALVVLDYEGSGRDTLEQAETPAGIADDLRARLERFGWLGRAEALIIEPELEVWVWGDSPHVDRALGWERRDPRLRRWLLNEGLWNQGAAKPARPKECMERALREVHKPRSSALYADLASIVSLERCRDPSFLRFRDIVCQWFPS